MVTQYWILKEFEIFGIVFYTKVIGKCKDDYCGIVPFFSLEEAKQKLNYYENIRNRSRI